MSLTVTELEAEIKAVEGVQVIIHAQGDSTFNSYREKWKTALDDERSMKAFKRRLATVLPTVSYSICKPDGGKAIFPQQSMGVLRGRKKEIA